MEEAQMPIAVTEKAAQKILEIREADEATRGKPLRLCVRGGGCAGFSYDLYFDEFKDGVDQRFTIHGVDIVVDNMSLMYLAGTELDFIDGLNGTGFKFNNPNVKSTCGCGSSFST